MRRHFAPFLFILLTSALSVVAWAEVPGPIKVSPNGRYFIDRTGKPFFWLGDTAWPLFTRYSSSQAEAYLKRRATQGFTVIHSTLIWGSGGGNHESPRPNPDGHLPWLNNDPATPNDAFFRHVDHLVDFANRQGLILALLPTSGGFVNDSKVINQGNARQYGRWVGTRYRNAPNIIWVNGGDRAAAGFEMEYRELARGLREGDQGAHLITFHPCGGRSSSQYFHTDDWLDFNMLQTWCDWHEIYPAVISDMQLSPVKPTVMCEGAYEDGPEYPTGPITPLIVRRQAWWSVMAGGSHTYGQNQMWRMQPEWERTLDSPGAAQVVLMKQILAGLKWWELIPDQSVFSTGVGSERTLNSAMRSATGDCVLVYLSSQCNVFLYMSKIAAKYAKATWIYPATGKRQEAGVFLSGNHNGKNFPDNRTELFSTPGHWEDAILLLEGVHE